MYKIGKLYCHSNLNLKNGIYFYVIPKTIMETYWNSLSERYEYFFRYIGVETYNGQFFSMDRDKTYTERKDYPEDFMTRYHLASEEELEYFHQNILPKSLSNVRKLKEDLLVQVNELDLVEGLVTNLWAM